MKTLFLQALTSCAILLPLSQASAKTYGDFAPGKIFTMTVKEKVSVQSSFPGFFPKKVPVPAGIPNYLVNQKIKFKIGPKGQLLGPKGLSLPFKSDAGTANVYTILPTRTQPKPSIGQVFKNTKNQPTAAALSFFKVTGSGYGSKVNTVTYTLK